MIWPWPRRRQAIALLKVGGGGGGGDKTPPGRGRGGQGGKGGGKAVTGAEGAHVFTNSQAIDSGSATPLVFDTVIRDDNHYWSNGQSSRLRIPTGRSGWCIVTVGTDVNTSSTGLRQIEFKINNTTTYNNIGGGASASVNTTRGTGQVLYLAAGDYVEAIYLQSSGAQRTLDRSNFSLVRVTTLGTHVHLTSSKAINASSSTPISWDAVVRDDIGGWAAGSPTKLVAPANGWYIITAGYVWAGANSGNREVHFIKNGTATYTIQRNPQFASNTFDHGGGICLYLVAGDYIEINALQTSTTNPLNITAGDAAILKLKGPGVHAYINANFTVGSGSAVALQFNGVLRDDSGFWSADDPSKFTIPAGLDGWYAITSAFRMNANLSGSRRMQYLKNGTTTYDCQYSPGSSDVVEMNSPFVTYLAAGDYIQTLAFQSSGGNRVVNPGDFSMVKL